VPSSLLGCPISSCTQVRPLAPKQPPPPQASVGPEALEEHTRPTRIGDDLDLAQPRVWRLTIVWHPDLSLIGAVGDLALPDDGAAEDPLIGRFHPTFHDRDGRTVVLGDPHVSRHALTLMPVQEVDGAAGWRLERPVGASRLRFGGQDIGTAVTCTQGEGEAGWVLTLADRVVLHGRLTGGAEALPVAPPAPPLASLVGVSPAMQALRNAVETAARQAEDVLLVGPTGTGKELVARALHALDPAPAAPWVAVNMAAIPPDLAAASLFGARRGAFTGADAHREGYFQQARGGTLFLDEVGDTPAAVQPQLLRALQEREVQIVGGRPERVDLRVISAMERDPDDPELGFRQALRFRLARQEIRVPALAERIEDLGLLVVAFLERAAAPNGLWPPVPAEQPRWLRLMEYFLAYPWPGNVRELEHVVGQVVAASDGGRLRVPEALLRRLREGAPAPVAEGAPGGAECARPDRSPGGIAEAADAPRRALQPAFADLDEDALFAASASVDHEPAALARLFGVSRGTVYRRIRASERCRLAAEVPAEELLKALDHCGGDLIQTARHLAVSRRGLEARLRAGGIAVGSTLPAFSLET